MFRLPGPRETCLRLDRGQLNCEGSTTVLRQHCTPASSLEQEPGCCCYGIRTEGCRACLGSRNHENRGCPALSWFSKGGHVAAEAEGFRRKVRRGKPHPVSSQDGRNAEVGQSPSWKVLVDRYHARYVDKQSRFPPLRLRSGQALRKPRRGKSLFGLRVGHARETRTVRDVQWPVRARPWL